MKRALRRLLVLAAAVLLSVAAGGAQEDARDVTDRFVLPDDLRVTLWAESPQLYNPTSIDVDARGRIWVAEAVNYRDFNNAELPLRPGGDRIVILEDTDGDGAADSSKVFVQDEELRAPLGIAVIGNRVVVSASPSVIVYTDEDGDDRPDSKETFLTGFGGYDHDHGLHAVVAGPDGRWYLNAGNAGPHVVTDRAGWTLRAGSLYTGGTPYNTENEGALVSDDGRVWVGGVALRIRPDGTGLTVLGHNFRNAYELAVDSYGDLWQNDNDDEVLACRTTWLMEGGNAGYFSADGTRTWQADRRPAQEVFTAHWHQDDPGVLPAGDRTGAGAPAGIVVYEGDALGPAYRGLLLSADAGRNVLFGYHPAPEGAGFALERTRFLSSVAESTAEYRWNDRAHVQDARKWFRPSDVAVGTDGALYVADWYDPIVGGHQAYDSTAVGRIYRIAPKDRDLRAPEIDLSTATGRIEALRSPAVHVRAAAFAALRQEGEAVVDEVAALLEAENPYHRARAVWLLAQLGASGVERTEAVLFDPEAAPRLRAAAFRALRQASTERGRGDVLAAARRLAADPSPVLRREAALALRDVPAGAAADVVVALAERFDGVDRWMLEAIGQAAEGDEGTLYARLKGELRVTRPERWDARFAALAWRLHPVAAVDDLARRAASPEVAPPERRRALDALAFVDAPAAARAMAALTRSDLADVSAHASWWMHHRTSNSWRDYETGWVPADAPRTAPSAELSRDWARFLEDARPMDERMEAALALAATSEGAWRLLGRSLAEPLPYQIRAVVAPALRAHPDRVVRTVAVRHFGGGGEGLDLDAVAALEADAGRGEAVFAARCMSCHRHGGTGGEVGPDLAGVGAKFDRMGLVRAVARPGETVAHGYEPLVVTLDDGTAVAGFLLADGEVLVLRDAYGARRVVERERVARRTALPASLMPGPAELGLTAQDVADVAAFLMAGS